jgi:hypothetical protein
MLRIAGALVLLFLLNVLATAVLWVVRDTEEKTAGSGR